MQKLFAAIMFALASAVALAPAAAAELQVAQRNAAPVIQKIERTSSGYAIIGRNFGRDKRRVTLFEGAGRLAPGVIRRMTNTRIDVRSRPPAGIRITVEIGGTRSRAVAIGPTGSGSRTARGAGRSGSAAMDARSRAAQQRLTVADMREMRRQNRSASQAAAEAKKRDKSASDNQTVRDMKAAGYSLAQIVEALKTVMRKGPEAAHAVLTKGGYPGEIVVVAVIKGFKLSKDRAWRYLRSVIRKPVEWMVGAMTDAGIPPPDVFDATARGGGLTVRKLAEIGTKVLGMTARRVAEKLKANGRPVLDIARWIWDTGSGNVAQTATRLRSWLGLSKKRLVEVMVDLGIPPDRIAGAVIGPIMTLKDVVKFMVQKGVSVAQVVAAVAGHSATTAAKTVDALWNAGVNAAEVAGAVKDRFGTSAKTLIGYMKQAGIPAADIASAIKSKFGTAAKTIVRWMKQSGYSALDVARAAKNGLGGSARTVIDWMIDAGYSANAVAGAAKSRLGASGRNTMKWLKDAGAPVTSVLNAVVAKFRPSALNAAKWMLAAGYGLNTIRQRIQAKFSLSLAQIGGIMANIAN